MPACALHRYYNTLHLVILLCLLNNLIVFYLKIFQPWEERMQKADEQGTLVFIENLDPLFTSSEVEVFVMLCLSLSSLIL